MKNPKYFSSKDIIVLLDTNAFEIPDLERRGIIKKVEERKRNKTYTIHDDYKNIALRNFVLLGGRVLNEYGFEEITIAKDNKIKIKKDGEEIEITIL